MHEPSMKTVDIVTALIVIALSVVVMLGTRHLEYWAEFAPGSAFAPFWVGAVGAMLGALLLVTTLRRHRHEPHGFPGHRGFGRVVGVAGGLWAMVVAVPFLGFIVAGIAFCLFLLLLIERRPLVPSLATTAVAVGIVYGVFVAWLGISLPQGVLGI